MRRLDITAPLALRAPRMKRILIVLLLMSLADRPASAQDAEPRPNILVIVADDLGYGDIGVHGGTDVPTPHIDALAARGVRFTSGYVASPYCSPSRAGFLTGRYPSRFGHEFNPHDGDPAKLGLPLDQSTIADRLRSAGYATGLVGKWHQGFSPAHHPQSRGFDDFFGFLVGGHNFHLHKNVAPRFGTAHSHDMIYRGRQVQRLDGYTTDLFTDEAIGFMDRHEKTPWFLYLAYNAVHTPLELHKQNASRIPASITDPQRRGYLSLLLGLDDSIGRISDHLKQTGLDRNTLVVFFGDNGGAGRKPFLAYNTGKNTPLRGDKGQTLEGGIRVPFVMAWPGHLPEGTTFDDPVSSLDLLPTACALAGVGPGEDRDGVNLLPYLQGQATGPPHESLFWRFGPQKAVRQGRWKLVDWRDFAAKTSSGWQLYDLQNDPGETVNLAGEQPERLAAMVASWRTWNEQNVPPLWPGSPTEDPPQHPE